jgi:ribosome-associated protein YbcJ (S4-like RNA binding protein)
MSEKVVWNHKFEKRQGQKCKDGKVVMILFEIED